MISVDPYLAHIVQVVNLQVVVSLRIHTYGRVLRYLWGVIHKQYPKYIFWQNCFIDISLHYSEQTEPGPNTLMFKSL